MSKNSQQDEKSRSQVKREFRELKELGKQLADLSKGQLRAMPLSVGTREALLAAKGMTRSALQRQYRRLSSLLAEEDVAALRAHLTGELQPHDEEVAALHDAEHWRDRLLSADEGQLAALLVRTVVIWKRWWDFLTIASQRPFQERRRDHGGDHHHHHNRGVCRIVDHGYAVRLQISANLSKYQADFPAWDHA